MGLINNVDYNRKEDIRFVSLIANPVQYLDANLPVGAYSTWTFTDNETLINRMNLYYSINPDNIPNVILYQTGDPVFTGLQLDVSHYQQFNEENYCLLVHPSFVKAS